MINEIEIEKEEEKRINFDNFYLAFNRTKNIVYAHNYDEEKFSEDIILDLFNKDEEGLILFNDEFIEEDEIKIIKQFFFND